MESEVPTTIPGADISEEMGIVHCPIPSVFDSKQSSVGALTSDSGSFAAFETDALLTGARVVLASTVPETSVVEGIPCSAD